MEDQPKLFETRLTVEGVTIAVSCELWDEFDALGQLYHFEFRSLAQPARPIPVSETGYLSHFAWGRAVGAFATPLAYAEAAARHLARQGRPGDEAQPSLFD